MGLCVSTGPALFGVDSDETSTDLLTRGPHRPDTLCSSLSFAHPIPPSGSLFFPTSPHTTRRLVHGSALPEEPDKGLRYDSYLVLPSQRPPKESHLLPLTPLGQINSLVISQSVCPLLTASCEQHIPRPRQMADALTTPLMWPS